MHSYIAYGLTIHSALPLPELVVASDVGADVVIQLGKVGRPQAGTDHTGSCFHMTTEQAYLFWEQVGSFLVRGGKEIIVDPISGVEESLIRLPLLGMVLAAVLQQRGLLVLHASAVAFNGDAVAFLGASGWGKSTLAATLYARGHPLVADDLVAVDLGGRENPIVLPGFPQLKLLPEAAAASLGDDAELLPRLASGFDKRSHRAANEFSDRPLPLRRMYLLGRGPCLEIEALQPQQVIKHLICQSYLSLVFKQSLQGVIASAHFLQCASLAGKVPLYWLKRQPSLATLPDLTMLVEEDLAQPLCEPYRHVYSL